MARRSDVRSLTQGQSTARYHDRYAHADSGIGIESVWRLHQHHDKRSSDHTKVVQNISNDMDDNSINSHVAMRVFR